MPDTRDEIIRDARVENLPELRAFVERACGNARLDEEAAFALQLVIDEVCANLVRHGYKDMVPGPIRMVFARDGGDVVVTVIDHGRTFHPEQAPVPNLDADWRERPVGGLGWHLIRTLVDELSYDSAPQTGNVLRLVKHVAS